MTSIGPTDPVSTGNKPMIRPKHMKAVFCYSTKQGTFLPRKGALSSQALICGPPSRQETMGTTGSKSATSITSQVPLTRNRAADILTGVTKMDLLIGVTA